MHKRARLYSFKNGARWFYVTTVRGVMRKHEAPRYVADDVPGLTVNTIPRTETAWMMQTLRKYGYTVTIVQLGDI